MQGVFRRLEDVLCIVGGHQEDRGFGAGEMDNGGDGERRKGGRRSK